VGRASPGKKENPRNRGKSGSESIEIESALVVYQQKRRGNGMSQIVVCQNANGIVVATDGMAVDFGPGGEMIHLEVGRLVQLSPYAAILAGGAADGVQMCHALKNFLKEERLNFIEEIYGGALPFLATEFERFMRKRCEALPVDPIHHVHFILAGYTGPDRGRPYRSYLLWTKKKLPRLDGDEISLAYTTPRIMGLEYTLNRLCGEDAPLDRLLPEIKKSLQKVAKAQSEIGPPFHYAFITTDGFQRVE
jgi:hypothetical protein